MSSVWYGWIGNPENQAAMVLDRMRTEAFATAIREVVRPGDVVVDAGAGAGILAMLAAKAGARRVYAIERGDVAVLASRLVKQNGLGDIVEVLRHDVREVTALILAEQARVVISETLGHFAPAEGIHGIFNALAPLVRPDAVAIPASYRFVCALARPEYLERHSQELANVCGLSFDELAQVLRRRPGYRRVEAHELRSTTDSSTGVDVWAAPPTLVETSVEVTAAGPVTAVVCSFIAQLSPGVALSSVSTESWLQTVLPVPTLLCSPGDVVRISIAVRDANRPLSWRCAAERVSTSTCPPERPGTLREGVAAIAAGAPCLRDRAVE